jgi:hypothetical protein
MHDWPSHDAGGSRIVSLSLQLLVALVRAAARFERGVLAERPERDAA